MNDSLSVILDYMTANDWAMRLATLEQMTSIADRHVRGQRLTDEEIADIAAAKREKGTDDRKYVITDDGTAIIPISGVIAKHARMVNGCSQPRGTSIEVLRGQLDQAVNDTMVTRIFLHIESPGGVIEGLADFAEEVYEAGFRKPVTAFADGVAASAAYWIGCQAGRFYADQTADVGAIGVYTLFMDTSKLAQDKGLRAIIVRSGQHKGVGAAGVEVTDANIAVIQERVDAKFEIFLAAILRGRGDKGLAEKSLRALADGRTYMGRDAVKNKLIDGVSTMAQALSAPPPAVRTQRTNLSARGPGGDTINENANVKEHETMSEQDKITKLDADKAVNDERTRIMAINTALAGDGLSECCTKAINDGKTVIEAKAAAFDAVIELHAAEIKAIQVKLDEADAKLTAIAKGGSEVVAPEASDADEEDGTISGDDGKSETYLAAVKQFKADGKTEGEAITMAAREFPKSHENWKSKQTMPKKN